MNTQINIAENGTTTLATAGKYCDRNIDVNVNVSTYEEDLEMYRKVVDRSVVEFVDHTITKLGAFCFRNCSKLKTVDSSSITLVEGGVFQACNALTAVILRSTTVVKLNGSNAFSSSTVASGTGFIYVPDSLVDSYKTATNWSTYADQIKPISELEE